MEGILFGLMGMIGIGLTNALSPVPAKKLGPLKTLFFRNIILSIFVLVVFLIFIDKSSFQPLYIAIAVMIAIFNFTPLLAFYKAIKVGKVGIITPIVSSSVIITVPLSMILYGEQLSPLQLGSILLIAVGIILITIDFKDFDKSILLSKKSGVPLALLAMVMWGIGFAFFKIPISTIGPYFNTLIGEITIIFMSGASLLIQKQRPEIPERRMLVYLLLMGLTGAIGILGFNIGASYANLSIVAAVFAAHPLVATIYGKLVYKDKIKPLQYVAIGLTLFGIVTLSYLSNSS